jgi:hypothetical protein
MWKQFAELVGRIPAREITSACIALALGPIAAKAVYLPPTGILGAMILFPALSSLCASIVTKRHLVFGGFAGLVTGLAGVWYSPKQSTVLFENTPFFADVVMACIGLLVTWLTGIISAYPIHYAHKNLVNGAAGKRPEGLTCLYGCCLGPMLGAFAVIGLTFLTIAINGGTR